MTAEGWTTNRLRTGEPGYDPGSVRELFMDCGYPPNSPSRIVALSPGDQSTNAVEEFLDIEKKIPASDPAHHGGTTTLPAPTLSVATVDLSRCLFSSEQ